MTDTPKRTLSLKKPVSTPTPETIPAVTVQRSGKRIIRREDLPAASKPKQKPATHKGSKPNPKKPTRKAAPKKPLVSPSDLKARELNDRLNAFPVWLNFQPLALGIEKDVFRLVNAEHFPGASKKVVQKTLMRHTRHARYLQALVRGGERFRLDGSPDGEIDSHQQQFAAQLLAGKETQGITIVQNIPSQQRDKVIDTK